MASCVKLRPGKAGIDPLDVRRQIVSIFCVGEGGGLLGYVGTVPREDDHFGLVPDAQELSRITSALECMSPANHPSKK